MKLIKTNVRIVCVCVAQASVHEQPGMDQALLVMKGAPERIISRCTHIHKGGQIVPITKEDVTKFEELNAVLGRKGERVLGFADRCLPADKFPKGYEYDAISAQPNFPLNELVFCGLVALIDPPRPAVPNAVEKCRDAGIKVIMVTGDHPITAHAIAKQVGRQHLHNENFLHSLTCLDADSTSLTNLSKISDRARAVGVAVLIQMFELHFLSSECMNLP